MRYWIRCFKGFEKMLEKVFQMLQKGVRKDARSYFKHFNRINVFKDTSAMEIRKNIILIDD